MNPLLPEARSTGYGRVTDLGSRRNAPSGNIAPRSLRNPLGYWTARYGLASDGAVGVSRACKTWHQALGAPGASFYPSGANGRVRRTRISPGGQLSLGGEYILYPGDSRWDANLSGVTRNLTFAVLIRMRRGVAAAVPLTNFSGTWLCSFTDDGAANAGVRLATTATAPGGYKLSYFDGSDLTTVGTVNDSLAACPIDWTFYAGVIDSGGKVTLYDQGRKIVTSGVAPMRFFRKFALGRTTANMDIVDIAEVGLWQSAASEAELQELKNTWLKRWGTPKEPTTTVSVTGDSIIAGEGYIELTTANHEVPTICERLHLRDRRLRVLDLTKSSTFVVDADHYMENLTSVHADAKGGKGFHSNYYKRRIHILQHVRNDIHRGDTVATVKASVAAAITNVKTFDPNILVGVGTCISTKFSNVTAEYPDQATFDAGCAAYNTAIRADVAGEVGGDFVVDWGADAVFDPSLGGTPWSNLTYYLADQVHPNGLAGANKMADILAAAIRPYAV